MPDEWILPYLRWHYRHGAIKIIAEGGEVTGLAVCRRIHEPPTNDLFDWEPAGPGGEHFIIGDIITTTGRARQGLCRFFLEQWPGCEYIWGHDREGRVKELSIKFVERLGR